MDVVVEMLTYWLSKEQGAGEDLWEGEKNKSEEKKRGGKAKSWTKKGEKDMEERKIWGVG